MKNEQEDSARRKFLKFDYWQVEPHWPGSVFRINCYAPPDSGKKVKVLTAEGKLVEVDSSLLLTMLQTWTLGEDQLREGIAGRKFVMVIDLARCANERKCVEGCQKMHNTLPPIEYLKVKRMQDSELGAPYWFQMCYHCDNPPCTKVCPVDATFKRSDGIVAVDSDRCIGCKFAWQLVRIQRSFNFGRP